MYTHFVTHTHTYTHFYSHIHTHKHTHTTAVNWNNLQKTILPLCPVRIVTISSCGQSHPSSIAMRYLQRKCIMCDPHWNKGHYYEGTFPKTGMKLARCSIQAWLSLVVLCVTAVVPFVVWPCAMTRDSSVVEWWAHDRKVLGSSPSRSGRRMFFSRLNFLCWFLFQYLFHPRVTAVACKRSLSFCQKCRLQVIPKHTCILHVRIWIVTLVHGCMVYTELAPMQQQFHVAPVM